MEDCNTQYSKLEFYNTVKTELYLEPYLLIGDFNKRKVLAKLRASNHRFRSETGRYVPVKGSPTYTSVINDGISRKCCEVCCTDDIKYLVHLPFFEPIIENEQHVLACCPRFHHIRLELDEKLTSAVLSWDNSEQISLFESENILRLAKYVEKIFKVRFPKSTP